jgi:hypothetical protein
MRANGNRVADGASHDAGDLDQARRGLGGTPTASEDRPAGSGHKIGSDGSARRGGWAIQLPSALSITVIARV